MSQQEPIEELRFEGEVTPAFPLAILESIRSHDRPGEVLEDEDLTISLPRRFGLTGVVMTQIQRYEAAQRAGRTVRLDEVMGIIRLVMRRPDAEPILRESGRRLARFFFRRTPELWQRILHRGPVRLALRASRRAADRALSAVYAGDKRNLYKPFRIRIADCSTARVDSTGTSCTMLSGLLEELLLLYTGKPRTVTHTDCLTRGGRYCEWEINPL